MGLPFPNRPPPPLSAFSFQAPPPFPHSPIPYPVLVPASSDSQLSPWGGRTGGGRTTGAYFNPKYCTLDRSSGGLLQGESAHQQGPLLTTHPCSRAGPLPSLKRGGERGPWGSAHSLVKVFLKVSLKCKDNSTPSEFCFAQLLAYYRTILGFPVVKPKKRNTSLIFLKKIGGRQS